MTKSSDEVSRIIAHLRWEWDLTRYAGAYQERMSARDHVIEEAIRQLPECVPLHRVSPRDAWRWTQKWSQHEDPEEVVKAVLNDKPDAMEQLKDAVEEARRGPEILNSLRAQWKELDVPVFRHQFASVRTQRKNLIYDAIARLPDVVRDIAFFRSERDDSPICKWNSKADQEYIVEAVLNDEPGAIDRLCASMIPFVSRSGQEVLAEMRAQWAKLNDPVHDIGLLRYAESVNTETGASEDITLESVNAERRIYRENFIAYAIDRLPVIAGKIAPPLRWRSDANPEDVAKVVLNGDEGTINHLLTAMTPSKDEF